MPAFSESLALRVVMLCPACVVSHHRLVHLDVFDVFFLCFKYKFCFGKIELHDEQCKNRHICAETATLCTGQYILNVKYRWKAYTIWL